MKTRLEQIERIHYMEQLFDFVWKAMKEVPMNQNVYAKTKEAIDILSEYYNSNNWKQDFTDDESGLLPKDLKRGVLSEDGIWNLLVDWHELENQLNKCH